MPPTSAASPSTSSQDVAPVTPEQRTQFFIFLLIAMCLVFAVSYTGRVLTKIRMDNAVLAQETRNLTAQERTAELQDRLAYVQSDAYVEEKARSEFGMVQPGDKKVVILPPAEVEPLPAAPAAVEVLPQTAPTLALPSRPDLAVRAGPDRSLPIWQQWLDLFRPDR